MTIAGMLREFANTLDEFHYLSSGIAVGVITGVLLMFLMFRRILRFLD